MKAIKRVSYQPGAPATGSCNPSLALRACLPLFLCLALDTAASAAAPPRIDDKGIRIGLPDGPKTARSRNGVWTPVSVPLKTGADDVPRDSYRLMRRNYRRRGRPLSLYRGGAGHPCQQCANRLRLRPARQHRRHIHRHVAKDRRLRRADGRQPHARFQPQGNPRTARRAVPDSRLAPARSESGVETTSGAAGSARQRRRGCSRTRFRRHRERRRHAGSLVRLRVRGRDGDNHRQRYLRQAASGDEPAAPRRSARLGAARWQSGPVGRP